MNEEVDFQCLSYLQKGAYRMSLALRTSMMLSLAILLTLLTLFIVCLVVLHAVNAFNLGHMLLSDGPQILWING